MVEEIDLTTSGSTRAAPDQRSRRGWERVTPQTRATLRSRETLRADGPSPSEEVIARHEAELGGPDEAPSIMVF